MRFWIDWDMVHLSIGGTKVKTVRSHPSVNDLAILVAQGWVPAGPPPLLSTFEPDCATANRHPGSDRGRRQQLASGRAHAQQRVIVHVAETSVAVEAGGETRVFRRTSTKPVRGIKRAAATDRYLSFLAGLSSIRDTTPSSIR